MIIHKEKCFKVLMISIFMNINTLYFWDIYHYKSGKLEQATADQGFFVPAFHIMNQTYAIMPMMGYSIVKHENDAHCAYAML